MYKRILMPVDGSETANKALVAALQLARNFGSRMRLVHVVDEPTYLTGHDHHGGYSSDLSSIMQEAGAKVLSNAMAIAQAAGVEVDNILFDSFGQRLGESVADVAKRWNADLIVVGTHGRHGLGRILMGSGAEQIIRLAPVPVLVIRSQESENGSRASA